MFKRKPVFVPGYRDSRLYQKIYYHIKAREYTDHEDLLHDTTQDFIRKNLRFLLVGMLVMLVFLAGILVYSDRQARKSVLDFPRNSFGKGSSQESLVFEKGGKRRQADLSIEEQTISAGEQKALFQTFFSELKETMKGENPSLDEVNEPLCFPESLDGYPFAIVYESADSDYILMDGSLGEKAAALKAGEEKIVTVTAIARWESVEESQEYKIRLIPPANKKIGLIDQAYQAVLEEEKKGRNRETLTIPAEYKGVRISRADQGNPLLGIWLLGVSLVVFIPVHRYLALKEEGRRLQEEAEKDFSLIVHYLVLYIEAGLVFSSAIRRIRQDYLSRGGEKRYAFEKIVQMAGQLDSGISQREACRRWGEQFKSASYRKLSLALIQSFDKGSRESARIMDRLEEEAFRTRVDRAKKEGEEAATKLLFPMILLLCQVMILVMFPALVRFQTF